MATKRTDKCCFESRHGGGWITPAAYLVELVCEKVAKKDKKALPNKFWNLPEWKKTFKLQILHANRLLKKYDIAPIVKSLNKRETRNVYSLGANFILEPLIKIEQKKYDETLKSLSKTWNKKPVSKDTKPRKRFAKHSIKDEL